MFYDYLSFDISRVDPEKPIYLLPSSRSYTCLAPAKFVKRSLSIISFS